MLFRAFATLHGLSLASLAALAACASGGNSSDARLLYHHCRGANAFFDEYKQATGPKVMVAGLNYELDGRRTFSCYWRRGADYAAAQSAALTRCRQDYQNCFVYAQGNSEEDWVRAERIAIAQEENRAVGDFVDGFFDGLGMIGEGLRHSSR